MPSWLTNLTEGTRHSFVERTSLMTPVIHGRATQTAETSTTVLSKFPRKTWGARACANSGYQVLLSDFCEQLRPPEPQ